MLKFAAILTFALTGMGLFPAQATKPKPLPTDVVTPWHIEELRLQAPLMVTVERGGAVQSWEQQLTPLNVAQLSIDGGSGKMLVKASEPLMQVYGHSSKSQASIFCAIGRKSAPFVYGASLWADGHTACFADSDSDQKFDTQLRGVIDGVSIPTVRKLKSAKRLKQPIPYILVDPLEYRERSIFGRIQWSVYDADEFISITRSFSREKSDRALGGPYIDLKPLEVGKRYAHYGVQFEIVEKTDNALKLVIYSGFKPDLMILQSQTLRTGIDIEVD